MKKFRKKQMTKFDYRMRIFVVFSVLVFAVTAIVVHPFITSNEAKNIEIQEKIAEKQKEIDTARGQLEDILDNETTQLNK